MNENHLHYPYADGDPFAQGKKYSYARYYGHPFISAWRTSRGQACNELGAALEPAAAEKVSEFCTDGIITTKLLLEFVFGALAEASENADCEQYLAELVKKFEVTNRIHRAYGIGFRAIDKKHHRDFRLYIRLAQIFELAFRRSAHLSYLNVFLKCMDTLLAVSKELDPKSRQELAWLINQEGLHMRNILAQCGVAE